jgi:hypothetical protein
LKAQDKAYRLRCVLHVAFLLLQRHAIAHCAFQPIKVMQQARDKGRKILSETT